MAGDNRSAYCGQCGNPVQAGDTFCGVCGSRIPSHAQDASPTREIPTLVQPPPTTPTRGRNRSLILAAVVGALLVLTLAGAGAMALTGLGPGGGLLGGTGGNPDPSGGSDASGGGSEEQEPTTTSSGPSEPSWMSDEEIAALEGFGQDYDEAVRREDWEETYSMLDEESQQQFNEEEWAEKQQILIGSTGFPPPLESVSVEQEEQVADGPVTVRLSYEDGSDETITAYMPQVVEDPSDSGVPKRLLTEEEISELEGLPSFPSESTSAAPESTTPGSYVPSAEEAETEAQEAAEEYYEAAGLEDWDYTYENLDAETRGHFSREEWFQKNEWFADNGEVIYRIESVDQVGTSSGLVVGVSLKLTYEDGSSSTRTTYFVYEDGEWKHAFGQEEQDLFMPDATFEEFVEAQDGGSSASPEGQQSVPPFPEVTNVGAGEEI